MSVNVFKKSIGDLVRVPVITAAMVLLFSVSVFADDNTATITVPSDYTADVTVFQVDGVTVTAEAGAEANTWKIPVEDDSAFITAIQYHGNKSDANSWPEHMATWQVCREVETVTRTETGFSESHEAVVTTVTEDVVTFTANRLRDDILGYGGFAIKPPVKDDDGNVIKTGGIRSYMSVPTSIKSEGLLLDGDKAYTVMEYGHLHIFSRNWNSSSADRMVVGGECVLKSACYIKDSRDIVFKEEGDRTVFANSLFDIADYSVMKYFRGYVKLKSKADGSEVYLYGPVVGRNPKRVAEQALANDSESETIKEFAREVLDIVAADATSPKLNAFFIGDSIMLGKTLRNGVTPSGTPSAQSDYTQTSKQPSVKIGELLAEETGKEVKCTLIANGGATYSEPGANLYNMPRLADIAINTATANGVTPDYIFLLAGVNDWAYKDQGQGIKRNSALFGDIVTDDLDPTGYYVTNEFRHLDRRYYDSDDPTYCMGFDRTLKKLMNAYPSANIVVCSPLRAWWDSGEGTLRINDSTGKKLNDYCYVQKVVSQTYKRDGKNVYFVNLYDLMLEERYMDLPRGENAVPEKSANFARYFPDRFHPTQEGYDIMCQIIIDELKGYGLL